MQGGFAGAIWATHAKLFPVNQLEESMTAATREPPDSDYVLEVDGRLKAEFATREGARTGANELKRRFPKLQIRILDADTKDREEVELPSA